jgi:hypothetical protein
VESDDFTVLSRWGREVINAALVPAIQQASIQRADFGFGGRQRALLFGR